MARRSTRARPARKCACGRRAGRIAVPGPRGGTRWEPAEHCRRCTAFARVQGVVQLAVRADTAAIARELAALRDLERVVRFVAANPHALADSPSIVHELDKLAMLRRVEVSDGN